MNFSNLLAFVIALAIIDFVNAAEDRTDARINDDDVTDEEDDRISEDEPISDDELILYNEYISDGEAFLDDESISLVQPEITTLFRGGDDDVIRIENIRTTKKDERLYRGLILANGLRVVVVSDPETDMAAASMTVNVGFMHDPEEVQGLAHFLEHMLFMGSEKFEDENQYGKFISEHAGSENGETGEDCQSYYFDISSDKLEEALDMMAQMFLNPLMKPSATERELNAVDSEMSMLTLENGFPIEQLQRSLSKPGHRHSNFNCGNKKTLETDPQSKGIDVRAKLLDLHSQWYSSNIMYMAVLGKESLDELEHMVVTLYGGIKNKEVPKLVYSEHPWGPEQLNRKVYFVPKTDERLLMIRFPTPTTLKYYKNAPLDYLSHLIGHEGPGSLFAELKERNWINALGAGPEEIPGFAFFCVIIDLAEKAMNHLDEIVKLTFQYIYLLRTDGVQKRVFDEIKKLAELDFEFKDTENPIDYVQEISEALQMGYPFEDILSYDIPSQWNPSIIKGFLEYLVPENMNILIGSKSFEKEADREEQWCGTKYRIETISEDLINDMWKITQPYDKFHIPPPNEYISENFDLYPPETKASEFPRIIHESKISQFWFKQDDEFEIPKFYVNFNIFSPVTCLDIKNDELSGLFIVLFGEMFTTRAGYATALAGLDWSIKAITCGVQVTLSGYTEKLPSFTKMFLSELLSFKVKEEKFEIQKESLVRDYKNFDTKQPYTHVVSHLEYLLYESRSSVSESLTVAKTLHMDDMKRLTEQLFTRVFIEGFIYGNCDEELAKDVISTIESAFTLKSVVLAQEVLYPRIAILEEGKNFIYEASHKKSTASCYLGYFQVGLEYPTTNVVITDLFAQIVGEKCFETLRTDEQLGYVVQCVRRKDNGTVSFMVLVQSERSPAHVHSRVEAFLKHVHQNLAEMSEEEYQTNKTSLRDQYLEKVLGQKERFSDFWAEITLGRYNFGRNEEKAKILESLTKEDVVEFFEKYIAESSNERRKLDIYVTSELTNPPLPDDNPARESSKVEDVVAFRIDRPSFSYTFRHKEVAPPGAPVKLYSTE